MFDHDDNDNEKKLSCVSQDFTFIRYNYLDSSGISVSKNIALITTTTLKWKLFFFLFLMVILYAQPTSTANSGGPFENSSSNKKIKIPKHSLELTQSINIQRQEYLQKQCAVLGYQNTDLTNLTENQMKHMIIDRQHRLLYCYVPKVACTNWKRLLLVISDRWISMNKDPLVIPGSLVHKEGVFVTFNELDENEREMVMSENYTRLIFVRHPFERLLSAYRNKLEENTSKSAYFQQRIGRLIIKSLRTSPTNDSLYHGNNVSFDEFVQYLLMPELSLKNQSYNEHWEPINRLCNPCAMKYNVIGKYETLLDDSALALYLTGADKFSFPAGQKKSSTRNLMRKYFDKLNLSAIRELYEIYFDDFRLFDYSLDEVLGFEFG